jgi:hypothetical protein
MTDRHPFSALHFQSIVCRDAVGNRIAGYELPLYDRGRRRTAIPHHHPFPGGPGRQYLQTGSPCFNNPF